MTPATDRHNLERVARALAAIEARPDPEVPFGAWEVEDGEKRWVERDPTPEEIRSREQWVPDPGNAASFDHLMVSVHGPIDIVPEITERMRSCAGERSRWTQYGTTVLVQHVDDLLARLTVPRRKKDAERVQRLRAIQRGVAPNRPR